MVTPVVVCNFQASHFVFKVTVWPVAERVINVLQECGGKLILKGHNHIMFHMNSGVISFHNLLKLLNPNKCFFKIQF